MNFVLEKRNGCKAVVGGREVTIFSSNDYLGLTSHPEMIKAAIDAADRFGTGTGGAPGTTGTTSLHEELRRVIADFKSRQNAVLFPSGYQANQAIHHSLDDKDTVFFIDKRHHPSAIDGVRLARESQLVRFDHNNLAGLEELLRSKRGKRCVVSLPSVFTVDGDLAPLDKLAELKRQYNFVLIIDDAHATGCLGKSGRGLEEHFGLKGTADFIMGTFSKALGSQGGFLAFDDSQGDLTALFRTHEYSTSLSAISVAAALKALELIKSDRSILESLRRVKESIIATCENNLVPIHNTPSMIMLIPFPDPERLQVKLFDDGFLTITVTATVDGHGQNCLRIVPMATHSDDDIRNFGESLKRHYKSLQ